MDRARVYGTRSCPRSSRGWGTGLEHIEPKTCYARRHRAHSGVRLGSAPTVLTRRVEVRFLSPELFGSWLVPRGGFEPPCARIDTSGPSCGRERARPRHAVGALQLSLSLSRSYGATSKTTLPRSTKWLPWSTENAMNSASRTASSSSSIGTMYTDKAPRGSAALVPA